MKKFEFTPAILASHIAILGKAGSGKTVCAKGIAENLLDADGRVCVIDPTGVWFGLRSAANGKKAAYPVVIFGGEHADIPINERHGEAIAEIIGTSTTPAIIDTSMMRVGERTRFFADFANGLLRKNKGPLHLFIDEAHLFAPQGRVADPQSANMLHAANNLVSLGRARGLRVTMISQRPAKLHKDSLTQVETMVAMRLIAPQDRRAIEDWIADQADVKQGKEIIASLPTLKTGQGWVWAPEIGILERVNFPMIKTFDSSKAPGTGGKEKMPTMAPINISQAAKDLQEFEKEAKANDPAALRRRIKELETKPAIAVNPKAELEANHRGYETGIAAGRQEGMRAAIVAIETALAKNIIVVKAPKIMKTEPLTITNVIGEGPMKKGDKIYGVPISKNNLPPGEKSVLIACAQYPDGIDRDQMSILTGYKRSTRDAYAQRLREKSLIKIIGSRIFATAEGIAALGDDFERLPEGKELQDWWINKLPRGEAEVLAYLIGKYPYSATREEISTVTDFKRSTRDAYLQRLNTRKLINVSGGDIAAGEHLF